MRGPVTVLLPVLDTRCAAAPAQELAALLRGFLAKRNARGRALWFYTPQAMDFARNIPADLVVYDNMDELSAFLGAPPELLELEDELFVRADLIFTGGVSLYEAKRRRHGRVHAFPSSVDAAHFARARQARTEPDDQRLIPSPRIGFFGVIDERMDLRLVEELADARPHWHFVMIGPVVKIDPAALPRRANLHWLGGKSYDALPDYLAGWHCGFMPFALNEATRFISPTKTPEFLAAGLRVASTPIADVVRPYGEKKLVRIASDVQDMSAALEDLLNARMLEDGTSSWADAVDAHLAGMSWDRTWAAMRNLMADATAPADRRRHSSPPPAGRGMAETAHIPSAAGRP